MELDRRAFRNFDWVLCAFGFLLPCLGLVVLYSAGYDPDFSRALPVTDIEIKSQVFLKQALFLGVGLIVCLFAVSLPTKVLYRVSYLAYVLFVLLVAAVLTYGTISNGSRRWLSFGAYNLQPSELVKIGVVLALSRYISKNPPRYGVYSFRELILPFLIFAIPMVLILVQPDLGTALSVGAIGFCMLLFVGIERKTLITLGIAGLGMAASGWIWLLRPYQRDRILTLFNPEGDPQGKGWQIIQSKIAVGSGELFGKGFLNGSQTQLEFLPERTTDFIFCVLAEEWGFLGSLIILTLYAIFLIVMLRSALKIKELYSSLVVVGIVSMLFFHVIVNLGMVVGFLPIVGIPLPFFSYGGSSLLTSLFCLGIVLGLTMRRTVFS